MQSFITNSHEVFIHIHQGCFAGTGAIVRLPQCQWSKPDGYGKISQCITTTKHSKAKTVCIFLGIYCILVLIPMLFSLISVWKWVHCKQTRQCPFLNQIGTSGDLNCFVFKLLWQLVLPNNALWSEYIIESYLWIAVRPCECCTSFLNWSISEDINEIQQTWYWSIGFTALDIAIGIVYGVLRASRVKWVTVVI